MIYFQELYWQASFLGAEVPPDHRWVCNKRSWICLYANYCLHDNMNHICMINLILFHQMMAEREWLWARWWKSKSFFCLVEGFLLLSFIWHIWRSYLLTNLILNFTLYLSMHNDKDLFLWITMIIDKKPFQNISRLF